MRWGISQSTLQSSMKAPLHALLGLCSEVHKRGGLTRPRRDSEVGTHTPTYF